MIKQIMPAPSNLYAVYKMDDGTEMYEKILYIALLENGDTELHSVDESGWIDEVANVSNFLRIEYLK